MGVAHQRRELRAGGTGADLRHRRFALGQDAWNLLPWLELMNKDPGFRFPGQSGNYYDTRQGTLSRQPNWAVFRNGRPAPLESDAPSAGSR